MGEEEEELSRETAVVQTVLAVKLDHQSLLEVVGVLTHDLGVRVFKDVGAADLDVALAGDRAEGGLGAEVDELPSEVPLVLGHVHLEGRGQTRIVPGRRLGVVVDKVHPRRRGQPHLPARGQRAQLGDSLGLSREVVAVGADDTDELLPSGVDPGRGPSVVVDKVRSPFWGEALLPSCR